MYSATTATVSKVGSLGKSIIVKSSLESCLFFCLKRSAARAAGGSISPSAFCWGSHFDVGIHSCTACYYLSIVLTPQNNIQLSRSRPVIKSKRIPQKNKDKHNYNHDAQTCTPLPTRRWLQRLHGGTQSPSTNTIRNSTQSHHDRG